MAQLYRLRSSGDLFWCEQFQGIPSPFFDQYQYHPDGHAVTVSRGVVLEKGKWLLVPVNPDPKGRVGIYSDEAMGKVCEKVRPPEKKPKTVTTSRDLTAPATNIEALAAQVDMATEEAVEAKSLAAEAVQKVELARGDMLASVQTLRDDLTRIALSKEDGQLIRTYARDKVTEMVASIEFVIRGQDQAHRTDIATLNKRIAAVESKAEVRKQQALDLDTIKAVDSDAVSRSRYDDLTAALSYTADLYGKSSSHVRVTSLMDIAIEELQGIRDRMQSHSGEAPLWAKDDLFMVAVHVLKLILSDHKE